MKRIWIDAGLCDGCLNCTLACMNAHRGDQGTIYDLDLTNPANESRNVIRRLRKLPPHLLPPLRRAGVRALLYERSAQQEPGNRAGGIR